MIYLYYKRMIDIKVGHDLKIGGIFMKKVTMFIFAACMVLLGKSEVSKASYPTKNVSGIVQWSAGGELDSVIRPLAILAEKELGKSIVIENKTGGTGSIATQHVNTKPADGYTLLMGAENPQLYTALKIIDLTYKDFEPVFIIGNQWAGVGVSKNSPYKSFTEIIDAAKKNPGTVTMSTTGAGGLPWEVGAFITAVTGAEFAQIPYDGNAAAKTAVLGGECDFSIIASGAEEYKSGDLKFLCMFTNQSISGMEEVPLITAEYPDFNKYLPWGPFYGVFVKKGTDPAIIETLSKSFEKAFKDESYQKVLQGFNINPLGLTGEEARNYLNSWQVNTVEALYKSGAIDKSPEELGLK